MNLHDDNSAKDALIQHLERELKAARETLRDRFALAAIPALVPDFLQDGSCAVHAYAIADLMIEARKQ